MISGSIMVGVVLLSRKCNINPDNVATPIAASLGDLTTLALLSGIACVLFDAIGEYLFTVYSTGDSCKLNIRIKGCNSLFSAD